MSETYQQLYEELTRVVNRYTNESDLTVGQAVSALEMVKANVLEEWHADHRKKEWEMTAQKQPNDREVWDKAVTEAKKESRPELTDDRPAIRRALREMRQRHTVRVRSQLP